MFICGALVSVSNGHLELEIWYFFSGDDWGVTFSLISKPWLEMMGGGRDILAGDDIISRDDQCKVDSTCMFYGHTVVLSIMGPPQWTGWPRNKPVGVPAIKRLAWNSMVFASFYTSLAFTHFRLNTDAVRNKVQKHITLRPLFSYFRHETLHILLLTWGKTAWILISEGPKKCSEF